MNNIANADRPKSAGAMLPPRPLRGSGKVAQTACNSDRREGKSCIPTLNQTFADSRILKISKFRTFRIAVLEGNQVMREFTLQATLIATIRVKAETRAEAEQKLHSVLAASDANLGTLDDEPIVVPVEVEGELDLIGTCEDTGEEPVRK